MNKIISYQIVFGWTGYLEKKVKDMMALGWQPLGGLTVLNENTLVQAMVQVRAEVEQP